MDAVDEIRIQHEIADNAFFHDFLLFLHEAGRQPFQLTKTGNLRLADIHHLGEQFALDIYHRDRVGEVRWTIRSERDVLHVTRMRGMAAGMRLTSTLKEKLLLTVRGKAFLADNAPRTQFETLTLWYLQHCDWGVWYDWHSELARALQQAQHFLWRYFLARKDTTIDFHRFLSGVRAYFGLDALSDDPYHSQSVRWAVEQMLVKDMRLFGLLSVESITWDSFINEETIYSFQPTALGSHIFKLALTQGAHKTPG